MKQAGMGHTLLCCCGEVERYLAVFRCIAHTAVAERTQSIRGSHFGRGSLMVWWVPRWDEGL
jgi:hypothetical protein